MSKSLTQVLQALYRSEINVTISCFWDGGWEVQLGDQLNGFVAETWFDNAKLDDAAAWLADNAKRHFPKSEFALTFDIKAAT
jgi:hypothetical protein